MTVQEQSALDVMIQQQVVDRGIRTPRVLEALRAVPRDLFFPEEIREEAFADRAAPIGHGQTISQPYMVALMTDRLEISPEHSVLELGTGSGYQTAILSQLAAEVYTMERVKPLLDEAFDRVLGLGLRNVHFRHGDGTQGWPGEMMFDRILITAGAPHAPETLLRKQLKDGGLAVLPIGPSDHQMLVAIRREGDKLISTDIVPCRFVKLIGDEGWAQ